MSLAVVQNSEPAHAHVEEPDYIHAKSGVISWLLTPLLTSPGYTDVTPSPTD